MSFEVNSFVGLMVSIVTRYVPIWFRGLFASSDVGRMAVAESYRELASEYWNSEFELLGIWCLERASKVAPGAQQAYIDLGQVYYYRGELDKAHSNFYWAVAIDRSNPAAVRGFATTLQAQGELQDAIYYYRIYNDLAASDAEVLMNLGNALQGVGQNEEAAVELGKARELEPDNESIRESLGRLYYVLGRYGESEDELIQAVKLNPSDTETHRLLGLAQQALGELTEAQANFRKALQLDADNGWAALDLARVLSWEEDLEGAIETAESALDIFERIDQEEDLQETLWELGWWRYLVGDLEGSIEASRKALDLGPDLVPVKFNLALALMAQGDVESSEAEYRSAALAVESLADLQTHGIDDLRDLIAAAEKSSRSEPTSVDLSAASGILGRLIERQEELKGQLEDSKRLGSISGSTSS